LGMKIRSQAPGLSVNQRTFGGAHGNNVDAPGAVLQGFGITTQNPIHLKNDAASGVCLGCSHAKQDSPI